MPTEVPTPIRADQSGNCNGPFRRIVALTSAGLLRLDPNGALQHPMGAQVREVDLWLLWPFRHQGIGVVCQDSIKYKNWCSTWDSARFLQWHFIAVRLSRAWRGIQHQATNTCCEFRTPHPGDAIQREPVLPVTDATTLWSTSDATIQDIPALPFHLPPAPKRAARGLQQGLGSIWWWMGNTSEVYPKGLRLSILGNTPITFPLSGTTRKSLDTPSVPASPVSTAYRLRALLQRGGRFFQPQARHWRHAGRAGGNGVFRIDHDEAFNSTAHLQYSRSSVPWWASTGATIAGWWQARALRGSDCNNGPNGTGSVVDFSGLTPTSNSRQDYPAAACLPPHDSHQSKRPVPCITVQFFPGEDSRQHGKRDHNPPASLLATFRSRRGETTSSTATAQVELRVSVII